MEPLKHECGIALVRLLKPLGYYEAKYGTWMYGLNKLYLMMEKQHNRGQEGAGMACLKLNAEPGEEFIFRERAMGTTAISEIFAAAHRQIADNHHRDVADTERLTPFAGEIYMGHLRYSTTGKRGLQYVHPFLRRDNWLAKNLCICANFNMTNVDEIFATLATKGQHPRMMSDTYLLLEQLGHRLDRESERCFNEAMALGLTDQAITKYIEQHINVANVLRLSAPVWDGGYALCGVTGSGESFVLRDPWGIRPCFWYADDEVIAVASERPVIQTTFDREVGDIHELLPGQALIIRRDGQWRTKQILAPRNLAACSFERIYFSRGSDVDIYRERKEMGHQLVDAVFEAVNGEVENTVLSYIPNTAETSYYGLCEGFDARGLKVRREKVVHKDIKMRTFIAEGAARNDLAAHVYDISYGSIRAGEDNLVVIDDSIVRGTTLRQSIIRILDRLHPKRIVIVSAAPQVRYPDYYGIDMSSMEQFIAFRAAIAMLKERGMEHVIDEVYERCKKVTIATPPAPRTGGADTTAKEGVSTGEVTSPPVLAEASVSPSRARGVGGVANPVQAIYAPFTQEEISAKIAQMLTPVDIKTEVKIIFQTIEGLHAACPDYPGDWYFTGNYPTPGGLRMLYRAFVNWYEQR